MNLFKFEFPIDLASAIVGFLLAISLYVFDKLLEPNITIEVTDPSDLNLSQGLFKVLNVKISNKHYKGILKFKNRTLTQARAVLTFKKYPTKVPLSDLENIRARWNATREPTTPDYKAVDFGSALVGSREVIVPGESTSISITIKKQGWECCYPFNNESYLYQEKYDFKRPDWEIQDEEFYVTVTIQAAEMNKELGDFVVFNKGGLKNFKISKI